MHTHSELVFFHAPHSRSGITRALLAELDVPFDLVAVDLETGEQRQQDYMAINPMGKVPAIRHAGALVTEQPAILMYLADAFAEKVLALDRADPLRGPYLRWMVFYGSCFEPALMDRSLGREPGSQRASGYGDYDSVMRTLAAQLQRGPWLLDERFTAADVLWGGALQWGLQCRLVPDWALFRDYADRVAARPAIRRAAQADAELAAAQAAQRRRQARAA